MNETYKKEYHCDSVLRELASGLSYTTFELTDNMKPKWSINYVNEILSILVIEDFIHQLNLPIPEYKFSSNAHQKLHITTKGRAFISTDSFVNRAQRWALEQKKLDMELKKITFEVSKLKITYRLAWAGLFLSIISLLLSDEAKPIKDVVRNIWKGVYN